MSIATDKTVRNDKAGPQAKADFAAGGADAAIVIDVLANDLGGSGKALWSLDQADPATPTAAGERITLASGAQVYFAGGQVVYDPLDAWAALDAGEQASDSFTYAIRLASGVVSYATATITITGMDDSPIVDLSRTVAAATVTEIADRAPAENIFIHQANGTIAFTDADAGNAYSATFAAQDVGGDYLGTFALDAVDQAGGSVGWSFELVDGFLNILAAGETREQRYDVTLRDGSGGTLVQTVTVTLVGSNDAPVKIPAARQTGAATERPDGAADENVFVHLDGGILPFGDIDLSDRHTPSFVPQDGGDGYLGTFAPVTFTDAGAGGFVQWGFAVEDRDLDILEAGEVRLQKYDVTVDDGNGGSAMWTVTIMLTGAADSSIDNAVATSVFG